MISHPVPVCACCGAPTPDDKRIDVRFGLPDAVLGSGESSRRHPHGLQALLATDNLGSFIRCLLPIGLTGDIELVIGTWLRISDADLALARDVWEEPAYGDLVLHGSLANSIRPWGDELLGAPVTIAVRERHEIPYATASEHPVVSRILTSTWDRDYVLSRFGHALAVPVRTRIDDRWSIERTAGLTGRVHDGSHRFAGPGRTVIIDALTHSDPDADPETLLTGLLKDAPAVPAAQQTDEREPGCMRHALWLSATRGERQQHELHGHVVVPGAALVVVCISDDADDLAWAQHVWRSVRVEEGDEVQS
ncbi:DUF2199 domain-containing protein [Streptacidiphilus sp. PAMC 29251]